MMSFEAAQQDMRQAYYDGAAAVVVSATVWSVAALLAWQGSAGQAIAALLIGGMGIFPVSIALARLLGRSGAHHRENPLAGLAASGTVWMLLAIPAAYAASLYKVEWFFPAMLLTIGGRYLTFSLLYGLRRYYLFGAALALAGIAVVLLRMPVTAGALAGALIEYSFGAYLFLHARR